jgi:hypothetical protein
MKRKVVPVAPKRPYLIEYFSFRTDGDPDSKGHAASEVGAIRASVVRVFLRQYGVARIYEAGVLLYTVIANTQGVTVYFGGAIHNR